MYFHSTDGYVLFVLFKGKEWSMNDLNIRQSKFLKAMLEKPNIDEACHKANISLSTGYKYLSEDYFTEEYKRLRSDYMQLITASLQKSSEQAIKVLTDIMNNQDEPAEARVQSATQVLKIAYRSLELDK